MTRPMALRWSPAVAFYRVDLKEAQDLLIRWRHPLHLPEAEYPAGRPYTRPFGRMPFVMEDRGRPAAVVVIASSVNASVARDRSLHRYNTLDLARIARSPDRRDQGCLRAVLRISRDYLVPLWLSAYPGWSARSAELCGGRAQIRALASTSLPGTSGGMYRFDGFTKVRTSTGAKGGRRQKPSRANAIADGARGLWIFEYPTPLTEQNSR